MESGLNGPLLKVLLVIPGTPLENLLVIGFLAIKLKKMSQMLPLLKEN